jgi:hypothetical protein
VKTLLQPALANVATEMGLVTASCLMLQGKSLDGTKDVARPYTPTTLNAQKVSSIDVYTP